MSSRNLRKRKSPIDDVDYDDYDGGGDLDLDHGSFTSSPSPPKLINNPLLYPEVLKVIFSWLDNDVKTLRTCREVCQVWNTEASNALRNGNSSVKIGSREELVSFLETISESNSRSDTIKGLTFRERNPAVRPALYPPTSQFWKVLNITGSSLAFIDISMVLFRANGGGSLSPKLKLPELGRLLTLTPNLTHLVLRELQRPFIQKQRFLHFNDSDPSKSSCANKLKSLILKNQVSAKECGVRGKRENSPEFYHVPCPEFYAELLSAFPNLEEIGYYFHLGVSIIPYLNEVLEEVEAGRLQKLRSITKFIYGANSRTGIYSDSTFHADLAKFKKISLRSNLEFIPAQLINCFESSSTSVEDLKLLGFHYNAENYITSINLFDENRHPIPLMEKLKRLCLRGGIPLEPFLLNAPNLQELTFSFFGVSRTSYDFKSPLATSGGKINFWNRKWLGQTLQPLHQLRRLDIGHCICTSSRDIKVIGELCPNLKELCVPSFVDGCISAVFQHLRSLQELDIILLDEDSELTDVMILGDPDDPVSGISALQGLTALRIRINEVSKLKVSGCSYAAKSAILEKCLLTDAFLVALKSNGGKLRTLIFEAGKFTESAWLSLERQSFPRLRRLAIPKLPEIPFTVLDKLRDQFPLSHVSFASLVVSKEGQEIAWSGLMSTATSVSELFNETDLI